MQHDDCWKKIIEYITGYCLIRRQKSIRPYGGVKIVNIVKNIKLKIKERNNTFKEMYICGNLLKSNDCIHSQKNK